MMLPIVGFMFGLVKFYSDADGLKNSIFENERHNQTE